jgi:hypothetical protein
MANTLFDPTLVRYCGFYCGSCPTYCRGECNGCVSDPDHVCFTHQCVPQKGLRFCGECPDFPCEAILTKEQATVLDKKWLNWKLTEKRSWQASQEPDC